MFSLALAQPFSGGGERKNGVEYPGEATFGHRASIESFFFSVSVHFLTGSEPRERERTRGAYLISDGAGAQLLSRNITST